MGRRIKIHKDYEHLREFILGTIQEFDNKGVVIQDNRNRVKIFQDSAQGQKVVVKSFEKVTMANKFIYRFFRKSKAQRSFENAIKLREIGISSPYPIAYIEDFSSLALQRSFYISAYQEHQEVNDCLQSADNTMFLKAMGEFLFTLHQNKVFHYDLHISNMLVTQDVDDSYEFHLIDINRLKFEKPSNTKRVKNLNRIFLPFDQYSVVIQSYADLAGINAFTLANKEMHFRVNHQVYTQNKRALKDFYKKLWCRLSAC